MYLGRGADGDYTLINTMVSISGSRNATVMVNVRVDGISPEEDESFQLRLVPNPLLSVALFCIDELNVTIEDGDGKRINNLSHT